MADDGLLMPTRDNPLVDTVTGATPIGCFILNTKIEEGLDEYVLFFEVNKSFDYNEFYSDDKKHGEPG